MLQFVKYRQFHCLLLLYSIDRYNVCGTANSWGLNAAFKEIGQFVADRIVIIFSNCIIS